MIFFVKRLGCCFFVLGLICNVSVLSAADVISNAELIAPDEEEAPAATAAPKREPGKTPAAKKPSADFVRDAWEASYHGDLDKLDEIAQGILEAYGELAQMQQSGLKDFPTQGREEEYRALNDVATVFFIKAEALMNYGKTEDAIALFQDIIKKYPWAQAWDPRGWFWSVAEKSQDSIDVMTGKFEPVEPEVSVDRIKTLPSLHEKGVDVVDYTKYGEFKNVGTRDYKYVVTDPAGLSKAVGEGIYPNTGAVLRNPGCRRARKEGRLDGNHWDYVYSDDMEAAFYKWATATEPVGVRLFYLGAILEKAGMPIEAIKAYQALVVHFPKTIAWTYWQTPWYPAQAAIAKIKHLIRMHPELDLKVEDMNIRVMNGFDNDVKNDIFITHPGRIRKKTFLDKIVAWLDLPKRRVRLGRIVHSVGQGDVRLVRYENGHWRLLVQDKPFPVRAITYAPTKVGQSPDKGTLVSWMHEDTNDNGLPDGPYDSWVDNNMNNQQDPDEPVVGDFQLMKEMGVNTIREYHQPFKPDKELLRKMHKEFGFYVIMGDFLGKYTLGSGATWFEGTDYENPEHQKNMMDSVRQMVMDFKDEPYILFWILGNENNYGVASNADQKPEAYFRFVNEVAKMIKSIDPNHPVAVCNGDTLYLDIFAKYAPDVDIYAANIYRGSYGFGSFWAQVQEAAQKPAFITEYGCPAYARHLSKKEAEAAQADYLRGNLMDIQANMAGSADGVGNALGGAVFEWTDEWWKNYEPFYHDRKSDAIGPFPGGYYYEEWFGLTSQGNGQHSPFLRQLRKSYQVYKEFWHNPAS